MTNHFRTLLLNRTSSVERFARYSDPSFSPLLLSPRANMFHKNLFLDCRETGHQEFVANQITRMMWHVPALRSGMATIDDRFSQSPSSSDFNPWDWEAPVPFSCQSILGRVARFYPKLPTPGINRDLSLEALSLLQDTSNPAVVLPLYCYLHCLELDEQYEQVKEDQEDGN